MIDEEKVKEAAKKVKNHSKEEVEEFYQKEINKYKNEESNFTEGKVITGVEELIKEILEEKGG